MFLPKLKRLPLKQLDPKNRTPNINMNIFILECIHIIKLKTKCTKIVEGGKKVYVLCKVVNIQSRNNQYSIIFFISEIISLLPIFTFLLFFSGGFFFVGRIFCRSHFFLFFNVFFLAQLFTFFWAALCGRSFVGFLFFFFFGCFFFTKQKLSIYVQKYAE